jgi:ribosomal protein L40E
VKLSEKLKAERSYIERELADQVICSRCRATLLTYAEKCSAAVDDCCPGYESIEAAKAKFSTQEQSR